MGHVRTSLEPKSGFWSPLRRQMRRRVVFGERGRRILRPRVAQEAARDANSDEKVAQMGPREIPKERRLSKPRKLRNLDFERPCDGLATFTAFGQSGRKKKLPKFKQYEHYGEYLKMLLMLCPPPPQANPPPKWAHENKS